MAKKQKKASKKAPVQKIASENPDKIKQMLGAGSDNNMDNFMQKMGKMNFPTNEQLVRMTK